MRGLTRRERTLLMVLGAVALLAVYWYAVYEPVAAQGAAVDAELAAVELNVTRIRLGEQRIEPLGERIEDAKARLAETFPGMEMGRNQASWTRAIEGVCTGSATLSSLRFLDVTGSGALMVQAAELEARVSAGGVPALLERLYGMDMRIQVTRFSVQAEQDGGCLVKASLEIPYKP